MWVYGTLAAFPQTMEALWRAAQCGHDNRDALRDLASKPVTCPIAVSWEINFFWVKKKLLMHSLVFFFST